MEFFTQTVDATLWSSRTFEDPEYDEDESAAALGRAPLSSSLELSAGSISTLIVGCGHDANLVLKAATNLSITGSFNAEGLDVPVSSLGDVACINVDVPDFRAALLAKTALFSIRPKRTLVLTSVARWACRGRPSPGISWIRTATASLPQGEILSPPSFLDGAAAAFVADADTEGHALSAAILVKEGISATYGELERMYETLVNFLQEPRPEWIVSESEFEKDVRLSLKVERASESAMYM